MTPEEMAAAVTAVLAEGLDAAFWQGQTATTKTAAINMATKDIFARLGGMRLADVPSTDTGGPVVCAVAEQAVYLVRTHDEQADGKVITGEGVQGLSISYTLIGDAKNVGLAPRAATFLQQAKRQAMGNMRFSRG